MLVVWFQSFSFQQNLADNYCDINLFEMNVLMYDKADMTVITDI